MPFRVEILCSDRTHPVYPWLERWRDARAGDAQILLRDRAAELGEGDILFLIACQEIVGPALRARFRHTLVIHESALPKGRGWSPLVWQLLEGNNRIPVTLLEAEDKVDSGRIWHQLTVDFDGTELAAEINARISAAKIELMDWALAHAGDVQPRDQTGEPSYYRKRTPADSELAADATFAESFALLRVADEERYPAFVRLGGKRYRVRLDPLPDEG
ncbi:MAG TPA: formyltransferase family protein [Allosphingosinicella sp.]|nr:formyltransferase family protein [Allosphingosinicella sp.]